MLPKFNSEQRLDRSRTSKDF